MEKKGGGGEAEQLSVGAQTGSEECARFHFSLALCDDDRTMEVLSNRTELRESIFFNLCSCCKHLGSTMMRLDAHEGSKLKVGRSGKTVLFVFGCFCHNLMIKMFNIYLTGIICEIIPKVDISLRYEILDLVVN